VHDAVYMLHFKAGLHTLASLRPARNWPAPAISLKLSLRHQPPWPPCLGACRIWSCAAVGTDAHGSEQLVGFITAKSVFLHEVDASVSTLQQTPLLFCARREVNPCTASPV
jgi:hypothetical protein